MTTWLPRWFALLVLVLPFVPVGAAAPPAGPSAAQVGRLIEQLGDDEFARREAATARLKEIGEPVLAALRKAASSPDLEIRVRATRVIQAITARLQIRRFEGHTDGVIAVALSPN